MSEIEEIELSIAHAKEMVSKKQMAEKLASNREFKKLILDGYFKDEAVRLASLSADVQMKEHRDEIFMNIQAISVFRQFMQNIVRMGEVAEAELREYQEALDEERLLEDEDAA